MEKKMKAKMIKGAALALTGWVFSAGSVALADETTVVTSAAPQAKAGLSNAFEVGLGFGYTQGFGNIGNNVRSLTDSGGAGTSAELDLGWRIDPNWLVGVYGTGAWLSTGEAPGNAHNNWSAGAGVQGQYHFLPGQNFDPWVGLGVGWRGYFINRPQGTDTLHGLDFARVQVGVDVPVIDGVAISPFVGAATTIFFSQELANQSTFSSIQNRNVGVFINAGLLGRFDLFGS
jgi:outer membrane protein W